MRGMKSYDIDGCEIIAVRDYLTQRRTELADGSSSALDLPVSNVLYYELKDRAWFCIRPSGTEPKIKIYYGVAEKSMEEAQLRLDRIKAGVTGMIRKLLGLD